MASRYEVEPLLRYLPPTKDEEGNVTESSEDKLNRVFGKHQQNEFLKFEQFKLFLEDLDLAKFAEAIDRDMYR